MIREEGEPILLLLDGDRAEQARAALEARLPGRGLEAAVVQWRQADYEWRDLARWHAAVLPMLTRQEVVFTDANEAINRIMLGVLEGTDEAGIIEEAANRGVPPEAVVVRITERPVALQSLQDRVRPTRGGLRINPEHPADTTCTMGFNVDFGSVATFMTNSHCTPVFGEVSDFPFFQSTWNVSSDSVGIEYLDPPLKDFGTFCPSNRDDCRWSDAALVAYAGGVDWSKGRIARTSFADRWEGSLSIAGDFWISGKSDTLVVGDTLHKMGATTGWTYGDVDQTCVPYAFQDEYLMCQDLVNAGVDDGDSGSPVFRPLGGDEVELAGILWGGDPKGTSPGARFIFSRIGAVEEDFQTSLDVTGEPPPPPLNVSLEGPSQIADGAIACSWWADTSGGVTPYSWVWTMNGDTVSTFSQFDYFGDPLTEDFILEVIAEDAESSRKVDILEVEVGPYHECEGGFV